MTYERTIRPDDRLRERTLSATRYLIHEIVFHRDHIRAAYVQNFRDTYHGSFFGAAWNIVLPLVPISIYTLLSMYRVFPSFEGVNPGSYVALGATIWFLLVGCIQQPLQTVRARNAEVMKTALPLSAMVISGFSQLLFETALRALLVLLLIIVTGSSLQWTAVLVPLALIPAIMLFFGVGLILGIANVIYTDVGRVTSILLQYGLFLSGVIFPVSSLPFSEVLSWNPAFVFIEQVRVLCFLGLPGKLWLSATYGCLGLVVFFLGSRIFFAMEYRVRGIN